MNRILKLLGIFLLAILSIVIIIPLSPILLPLTLLAFWFFSKRKPNERFKKFAKNGVIASSVGLVFFIYIGMTTDPESEVAEVGTVETVAEVDSKEADEEDAETEEERAE